MMMARSESVSAVETSAMQRLQSGEAATRPQVANADALARSRSGAEGGSERGARIIGDGFGRPWLAPADPLNIVRAAQWVDSLTLKVDVQDGGVTLTLRLRAP